VPPSLPDPEITARIEAALYAAGRPLSVSDLMRAAGINSKEKVVKLLNELIKRTQNVLTALEIAQLDDEKFVFQVKPAYMPLIRRFAQQPLIPVGALKTLSFIAYEQPITSKRLVQIRGSQVYSHLKELRAHSFIESERLGRMKIYRTSRKFQEYFGINDLNVLKSKMLVR
jgi:segregation and condensation protein B